MEEILGKKFFRMVVLVSILSSSLVSLVFNMATYGLPVLGETPPGPVNQTPPEETGILEIVKKTNGGYGTFRFTVTGPTSYAPSITTSDTNNPAFNSKTVTAGSYTVAEIIPDGWEWGSSASTICNDDTSSVSIISAFGGPTTVIALNVTVTANKKTTCTFVNDKKDTKITGTLKIIKGTRWNNQTANGTFNFIVDGPTSYNPSITTVNSRGENSKKVKVGIYAIKEIVPDRWELYSLGCDSGATAMGDSLINLKVIAGKTTTCRFNNKVK